MPKDVQIRPVRPDDAEAVYEVRTQPSIVEFTLALPSARIDNTRRFLESFGPDDHVLVAVVDGRAVGMAGLHVKAGKQRHSGTVGIMVHDQHQGRGIGRALLAALLDLADNQLGLRRVELEVHADNPRAITLYERLGFAHEGCKRQAVLGRNGCVDVLVMGRLRGEASV